MELEEWTEVKIRNQKAKAILKENIIQPFDTLQYSNLSRYSILDEEDQDDETSLIKEKEIDRIGKHKLEDETKSNKISIMKIDEEQKQQNVTQ